LLEALAVPKFEVAFLCVGIGIGLLVISAELIDGEAVLLLEDFVYGELMILFLLGFLLYVDGNGDLD
jgi:hypothetical protein